MSEMRIRMLAREDETLPWPWEALLEEWDGTEWRLLEAEVGDTEEEARTSLIRADPRARLAAS